MWSPCADELRLPDCNACLVFDGVSSKYLPSIEQTALPGCKQQLHAVIHSTDWFGYALAKFKFLMVTSRWFFHIGSG